MIKSVPTILRSYRFRLQWDDDAQARFDACEHHQRAVYNRTVSEVEACGGPVPALQKSSRHPDGLYGRLTQWRAQSAWLSDQPVTLQRPAMAAAHAALCAHEKAVGERVARLVCEDTAWRQWREAHPDWDAGAWDALSSEARRALIREGGAPPKPASRWRDERGGRCRTALLRRRKRRPRRRCVRWDVAPTRRDAHSVRLPGFGVAATHAELPEAGRIRSARMVAWRTRCGAYRAELHLTVRVDVPETRRAGVAGCDRGCIDAVALDDGTRIAMAEHEGVKDRALDAQQIMSRCVRGSRQFNAALDTVRRARRLMTHRDTDAINKAAAWIASQGLRVLAMEGLHVCPMMASARGRGVGEAAKRGLNRRIARARWGYWKRAIGHAMQARGGVLVEVPAMHSSRTCAACGHVDADSRRGKQFVCTACAHEEDADVNAAAVLRQRAQWCLDAMDTGTTWAQAVRAQWTQLAAQRKRTPARQGRAPSPQTQPGAQSGARRVPGPAPEETPGQSATRRRSTPPRGACAAQPVKRSTGSI